MFRVLTCVFMMAAGLHAQVAVVNVTAPFQQLDATRVRDMFLGRVTTWPDGTPVIIVLTNDPAADAALVLVVGRDREWLLRGWKRLVFSGTGAMPLQAASEREGLELLARQHGAILIAGSIVADERWRSNLLTVH